MPSGTDRYWFHGANNERDAQRIYKKYSKLAEMSQGELRAHIEKNWNGNYAAFENDYNNHVNSHYRFKSGSRRKHGTNPFDANPQAKLDLSAVSADWHFEKGADQVLGPLESAVLGEQKSFLKDNMSNRYSAVMKEMLGEEVLNINKGGFKSIEEYSFGVDVDKKKGQAENDKIDIDKKSVITNPIKHQKDTLKARASGHKPIDTGGKARGMLAALARKGASGVSPGSAAQSSMAQQAAQAAAANSQQQIKNNMAFKDRARSNLVKFSSNIVDYDAKRQQDLQSTFGETVMNLANLATSQSDYSAISSLNKKDQAHFDRKK